jgi:hypothetical protein
VNKKIVVLASFFLAFILLVATLSSAALAGGDPPHPPLDPEWKAECATHDEATITVTNTNDYAGHLIISVDGEEIYSDYPLGGAVITRVVEFIDGGFARIHEVEIDFWAYDLFFWDMKDIVCERGYQRSCQDLGYYPASDQPTEQYWHELLMSIPPYQVFTNTFENDGNATYFVATLGWQAFCGDPPCERQEHEEHVTIFDGGMTHLTPDLGDKQELGDDTYWTSVVTGTLNGNLLAEMQHAGPGLTPESHIGHVYVNLCVEAPDDEIVFIPFVCNGCEQEIFCTGGITTTHTAPGGQLVPTFHPFGGPIQPTLYTAWGTEITYESTEQVVSSRIAREGGFYWPLAPWTSLSYAVPGSVQTLWGIFNLEVGYRHILEASTSPNCRTDIFHRTDP